MTPPWDVWLIPGALLVLGAVGAGRAVVGAWVRAVVNRSGK